MDFQYLIDSTQINDLIGDIQKSSIIALDTESTGLDCRVDKLIIIQFMIDNQIYILDTRKINLNDIIYIFQLIKDSKKKVILHNAKHDLKFIYMFTGEMLTNIHDTMLTEVLINAGIGDKYPSLGDVVKKYSYVDLDKEVRSTFENFDGELSYEQLIYSSLDVKYLREVYEQQMKAIEGQKQTRVYELEMEIIPAFTEMELEGVLLNKELWLDLEKRSILEVENLKNDIHSIILGNKKYKKFKNLLELADYLKIPAKTKKLRSELEQIQDFDPVENPWLKENFNIGSHVQLLKSLQDLGVSVESTGEKVISSFKHEFEIIEKILKYRELSKSISTYGSSFLEHIHPITGRIHTDFHQLGAATGRVSSSNPNLQNIKKESEYRSAFISKPGYKIITADYNQAELRILGWVSKEPEFIKAYKNGEDLHKVTGGILYNVKLDDVTKQQRYDGKQLNFGIVYGITEYGMLYNFGVPVEIGRERLKKYFEGYKNIRLFIDIVGKEIWKRKYSVTPLGRRRFFEDKKTYRDLYELDKYEKKVKREGINHIIQGGSADVTKLAIKNVYYNNPFKSDLKLLLQEHDELVLEVKEEILDKAKQFVVECMLEAERPFLGDIPSEVDCVIDDCWSKGE